MPFLLAVLFFSLFLPLSSSSQLGCSVAHCSNKSFPIRFPFRAEGEQPQSCGFSGFNLSCTSIGRTVLRLPNSVSWPLYSSQGLAKDLNEDLELSWYSPNCRDCELNGSTCGFNSNTTREISCFYNYKLRRKGLLIFRIICLSIALPAVLCALGTGCFLCCTDRRLGRSGSRSQRQNNGGAASVAPQPATIPVGLDESTIQSFTKLVLRESMRVIGPNNNLCPICLSDYIPEEILRCIPECQHCFHADCIDEWLRMNSSCPVCRNSPSPARAASEIS